MKESGKHSAGRQFSAGFSLKLACVRSPCLAMAARLFINFSPGSHQPSFSTGTFILGVKTQLMHLKHVTSRSKALCSDSVFHLLVLCVSYWFRTHTP